ncbi:MAG: MBL fold metallo-hydrolase [Candidatus Roizmanbacteria bacterium]
MEIKYIAHSSFQIKTKTATIVTDPYSPDIGIKFPKSQADIVTLSHAHPDHNNLKGIEGSPIVLDWPGEYEIKSTFISGISAFHDDKKGAERGPVVMFKIHAEGLTVLHAGDLGHKLDDAALEAIGNVDVLMIPVGGTYTIDANTAAQVVKQIDPSIVIPMHYGHAALNQKTFAALQPLSDFLQMMGHPEITPVPRLTVKHEDIAAIASTKVVALDLSY